MTAQDGLEATENKGNLTCYRMRKSVTSYPGLSWTARDGSLHSSDGQRKYLNRGERGRALAAMRRLPESRRLFAQVMAWTGARVSEVLALTPRSFQLECGLVTIVTLKRRRFSVREVPVPADLMAALERFFGLRQLQVEEAAGTRPLWRFCRMTAWRILKTVMRVAGVSGPQACPKGLRHAFGVGTLQAGVPLNLTQKWMGHARISTTAIYADIIGPEEAAFAARFWRS